VTTSGGLRLASLPEKHLRVLVEQTGLTANLSVREGEDQVTLARAESDQPYALSAPVGSRYPVVLGASGACLLSALPARQVREMIDQAPKKAWRIEKPKHLRDMIKQVQQQGSCQNIGIHPQGIETISAPVRSEAEGVVAAVTLVGLRGELESLGLERVHDLVRQAALACSASLLG
jgi:DNA-binding IclR family transcriptional regulator